MNRFRLPLIVLSGMALGLLGLRGAAAGESGSPLPADLLRAWGGGLLASALACLGAAWLLYLRKDGLTFLRRKPPAPGKAVGRVSAAGEGAGTTGDPAGHAAGTAAGSAAPIRDFGLSGLCLFLLSLIAQYLLPPLLR